MAVVRSAFLNDTWELLVHANADVVFQRSLKGLFDPSQKYPQGKVLYKGRPIEAYVWFITKLDPEFNRYSNFKIYQSEQSYEQTLKIIKEFVNKEKNVQLINTFRKDPQLFYKLNPAFIRLEQLDDLPLEQRVTAYEELIIQFESQHLGTKFPTIEPLKGTGLHQVKTPEKKTPDKEEKKATPEEVQKSAEKQAAEGKPGEQPPTEGEQGTKAPATPGVKTPELAKPAVAPTVAPGIKTPPLFEIAPPQSSQKPQVSKPGSSLPKFEQPKPTIKKPATIVTPFEKYQQKAISSTKQLGRAVLTKAPEAIFGTGRVPTALTEKVSPTQPGIEIRTAEKRVSPGIKLPGYTPIEKKGAQVGAPLSQVQLKEIIQKGEAAEMPGRLVVGEGKALIGTLPTRQPPLGIQTQPITQPANLKDFISQAQLKGSILGYKLVDSAKEMGADQTKSFVSHAEKTYQDFFTQSLIKLSETTGSSIIKPMVLSILLIFTMLVVLPFYNDQLESSAILSVKSEAAEPLCDPTAPIPADVTQGLREKFNLTSNGFSQTQLKMIYKKLCQVADTNFVILLKPFNPVLTQTNQPGVAQTPLTCTDTMEMSFGRDLSNDEQILDYTILHEMTHVIWSCNDPSEIKKNEAVTVLTQEGGVTRYGEDIGGNTNCSNFSADAEDYAEMIAYYLMPDFEEYLYPVPQLDPCRPGYSPKLPYANGRHPLHFNLAKEIIGELRPNGN
jgi:hypothetical protein